MRRSPMLAVVPILRGGLQIVRPPHGEHEPVHAGDLHSLARCERLAVVGLRLPELAAHVDEPAGARFARRADERVRPDTDGRMAGLHRLLDDECPRDAEEHRHREHGSRVHVVGRRRPAEAGSGVSPQEPSAGGFTGMLSCAHR